MSTTPSTTTPTNAAVLASLASGDRIDATLCDGSTIADGVVFHVGDTGFSVTDCSTMCDTFVHHSDIVSITSDGDVPDVVDEHTVQIKDACSEFLAEAITDTDGLLLCIVTLLTDCGHSHNAAMTAAERLLRTRRSIARRQTRSILVGHDTVSIDTLAKAVADVEPTADVPASPPTAGIDVDPGDEYRDHAEEAYNANPENFI